MKPTPPSRPLACLTATLAASLIMLAGCDSGPTRIDPTSNDAVTTTGLDYADLVEVSSSLTDRMIADGFLDQYQTPVPLVISDIENKTDISALPKETVMGRIRATLRSARKVRVVSSYGREGTDVMSRDTRDLPRDPLYDNPDWNRQGTLTVARLSLRTQFLFVGARENRQRQNTYEVRMFVTDLANGEVVWEGFSEPIAKKETKGIFGF